MQMRTGDHESAACASNEGYRWKNLFREPERLQTSRGRRSSGRRRTTKTILGSERRGSLKKGLTEPTLIKFLVAIQVANSAI